jgi:hypothetical protein
MAQDMSRLIFLSFVHRYRVICKKCGKCGSSFATIVANVKLLLDIADVDILALKKLGQFFGENRQFGLQKFQNTWSHWLK